jgi:hypothetical protein
VRLDSEEGAGLLDGTGVGLDSEEGTGVRLGSEEGVGDEEEEGMGLLDGRGVESGLLKGEPFVWLYPINDG